MDGQYSEEYARVAVRNVSHDRRYCRCIIVSVVALCPALNATAVTAGPVEIVAAEVVRAGSAYKATVTLRHDDTGWEHYADAWRLITAAWEVLATRVLTHPHVDEQPFTRSLDGIHLPDDVRVVYVEARDTVHGWAPTKLRAEVGRPMAKSGRETPVP